MWKIFSLCIAMLVTVVNYSLAQQTGVVVLKGKVVNLDGSPLPELTIKNRTERKDVYARIEVSIRSRKGRIRRIVLTTEKSVDSSSYEIAIPRDLKDVVFNGEFYLDIIFVARNSRFIRLPARIDGIPLGNESYQKKMPFEIDVVLPVAPGEERSSVCICPQCTKRPPRCRRFRLFGRR